MSLLDPTEVDPRTTPEDKAGSGDRQGILAKMWASRRARLGAGVLIVIVLWAVVGPLLYPIDAETIDPLAFSQPPSAAHWFGTNDIGQDVYARTLVGLQKSLLIGFIAGPGATLIAAAFGSIAGYFGGIVDRVIVWIIDLLLVIPSFYILIVLSPVFKNLTWLALIVGIAAFSWMVIARVIRGQTMSLREREYVKAARFMGVPDRTIIRRHIIPNVASLLIIDATIGVGAAILLESTLSFFGFGIQVPDVSLGTLLSEGQSAAVTRPWLFVPTAATLVVTVLAASLLGDALRDAIDPTSGANRD